MNSRDSRFDVSNKSMRSLPATAATPHPAHKGVDGEVRRVEPRSIPMQSCVTNLDFDVTENCNLGCGYCFKGEKYTQNMSLDTMKSALDWLLDASGHADKVNCNFMGGEPTMRWKQIREFVPWARRRGRAKGKFVSFSMTSNLTLWTEEIRSFVDRYGFGILMSIDGCPEVQDSQRPSKDGKKASEQVEYWARSLLRTRPRSTARATLTAAYAGRLHESIIYLSDIGFREVAISAAEYEKWRPEDFSILRDQLGRCVDLIVDKWRDGKVFNLTVFKYYIKRLIKPRDGNPDIQLAIDPKPCGAGRGYMMIDYTGDIWPCHRFDGADEAAGTAGGFRFGNIFQGEFNDGLQRAFLDFDHGTMHKASCDVCPVNPVCGGYCPAANVADTGSIYTPHEAFCAWSQLMYESARVLYGKVGELNEVQREVFMKDVDEAVDAGDR